MRMDGPMVEEPPAEVESGAVGNETHSALWARPPVEAFDSKEKAITFQVSFRPIKVMPVHAALDILHATSVV